MGRGGYDTTDAKEEPCMADTVLAWEEANRNKRDEAAAVAATMDAELKLIKSKKSRGIMAAKKAAKEGAVKSEPANSR